MCGAKHIRRLRLACGIAAISLSGMAAPVCAQSSTFKGESVVVTPLSFIEVNDLSFGSIIPSNQAGNVVLAPNGTRTSTNGIVLVGSRHEPAEFAGMGARNQIVQLSVGAAPVWLTGPGTRMRVRNFTVGSTPTALLTPAPRRFRINSATGIFRFPVGAELQVGANQAPGVYNGTWTITLNYE
jgi:hypothetical protein